MAKNVLPVPTKFDNPEALTATVDAAGRTFTQIAYARVPGFRPLTLTLCVPDAPGPVPVVLHIHGGAWMLDPRIQGMAGGHDRMLLDALNATGFATASVSYRLSGEAPFPAGLHDVVAAVRYLRTHAAAFGLDGGRIRAFGASAGAYLASFLAAAPTDPELLGDLGVGAASDAHVERVVSWFPPIVMRGTKAPAHSPGAPARSPSTPSAPSAPSPEAMLLGPGAADPAFVAWASPHNHVSASSAPLLLIHGDSDTVVPHSNSERMRDAYASVGAPVELLLVPGANHIFAGVDPEPLIARSLAWLTA